MWPHVFLPDAEILFGGLLFASAQANSSKDTNGARRWYLAPPGDTGTQSLIGYSDTEALDAAGRVILYTSV